MPKIVGSCPCGNVRFESSTDPGATTLCHCRNCQKQTGTAFSVILAVPENSLTFSHKGSLAEYLDKAEAGGAVRRRFCANRGSPVVSIVESKPGIAFIKAGTLEDCSWLAPTQHNWCDSAQPWIKIPDDACKVSPNWSA